MEELKSDHLILERKQTLDFFLSSPANFSQGKQNHMAHTILIVLHIK